MHRGPCHAISWVWWWFLPHQPRLYPFPKSVWFCVTCRWLAESCHPLSQLLVLTFGISPQDGYSRGSSRTSCSQAVSPCVLLPQSRPSSWSNLPFCPYTPSSTETPQAWGVCACLGARTKREGEGCVAETPPPARALMHFREQVRHCLLLRNWSDGIRVVGLYINAPALISSFGDFQASFCVIAIYFFLKKKKKEVISSFSQLFGLEGGIKWILF